MVPRRVRLAGIPLGLLALGVRSRVEIARSADPEGSRAVARQRSAAYLRDSLGNLKGGALKAGQLLSTVDSLFPADPDRTWAQALTALQESVAPVPFASLEPTLRAELGPDWRRRLLGLDPVPAAAASLGQVHRARLDGRDVAVKVQYPGIDRAIESDVGMLRWALRAGSLVSRGLVVPPVIDEIGGRLRDELDYVREARHQEAFARAFGGTDVHVPQVRLATRHVLVTDWLDASPLASLESAPETDRSRAGERYQRFLLSAPARAGLLHADPHPGNFRVLPDGRLGVLDFGAVMPTPGGMPEAFGRLIRVMCAQDPDELRRGLEREGFLRPGADFDPARLAGFLSPFTEPARCEEFAYSPEWLRAKFTRGPDDVRDPDYAIALQLTIPAGQLLTHRVWLGCVGVLCRLRATIPVAPELRRWLPGFSG